MVGSWSRGNIVLTSWDCRTQHEGIRGQRVGIRGQRIDGRDDRINKTIANCLIGVTFTFSYISKYAYIYICVYVYLLIIWVFPWVEGDSALLIVLMRKSRSYNCGKWEGEFKWYLKGVHKKGYWKWSIHRLILVRCNNFVNTPIYLDK